VNRRQAPRRTIERVERVGDWGEVAYHHHLSCGHVEVRPRSKSGALTCGTCIAAQQLRTLAVTGRRPEVSAGYDAAQEASDEAGLRARIAAEFRVDTWDVVVSVGERGTTATVFLDTTAVGRFQ